MPSMNMVMIVYNEAAEGEVMDVLKGCGLENYTKLLGVYGKGASSGTHLGNDVWPGRNNLMYIACPQEKAKNLLTCIRGLRRKIGRDGVKAFVLPLEEMT